MAGETAGREGGGGQVKDNTWQSAQLHEQTDEISLDTQWQTVIQSK